MGLNNGFAPISLHEFFKIILPLYLYQGQSPDLPIDHQVPLTQGSLTEGEISVQLTPLYSLVYTSSFCIEYAYFSVLQNKLSQWEGQVYWVFPFSKGSLLTPPSWSPGSWLLVPNTLTPWHKSLLLKLYTANQYIVYAYVANSLLKRFVPISLKNNFIFLPVWQCGSAGSRHLDSGGQIFHRNFASEHPLHVGGLHHDLHRLLRHRLVLHRSIRST